ncbi:LacI family DNA-binding transcriptional regulator [Bengtsoniella intestinalis]|uniref:LacI family DNA-binding transcriptional regulator n=1 Tax=Bengtsoniella intestinalis TaxID=3073143 RepID=UPI00391EFB28
MKNNIACATRADVAKLAGVSETVVSYVINDNRYVEKTKRARVLAAIDELHYQPNSIARAMKGKGSKHIMFIADHFSNGNFGELLSKLDTYAYQEKCFLSLCTNRDDEEFIRQLISRRLDGIIISSVSFLESRIQQLIDAGIPVVLLKNRDYNNVHGAGMVSTGLYQGAGAAVQYLYDKGRRHFLYIDRMSTRNHFSTMEDFRLRGFADKMDELGLDWKTRVITGCASSDEVVATIQSFMEHSPVDTIFARNDNMACLGLQAVVQSGRLVPQDISVMGFDSTDISRYVSPSLTTMEVEKEAVAKAAIQMLIDIREGKPLNDEGLLFPTKLIERQST